MHTAEESGRAGQDRRLSGRWCATIHLRKKRYDHKTRPPLWFQWSEFLATDPEVPGSIPCTTKKVVGLERGPLSLVSANEELLGSNSSDCGLETDNTAVGIRHADHVAPSIRKEVGTNFAEKRWSLGRYSSLANWGHGVFFMIVRPAIGSCGHSNNPYGPKDGGKYTHFSHLCSSRWTLVK
jgi:hypothetical protein